jgi:hypothetical protein
MLDCYLDLQSMPPLVLLVAGGEGMLDCYLDLQSMPPLALLVAKALAEMSAVPPHWPNTPLDLAKRREGGGLRRRVVLDLLRVLTWQDLGYCCCCCCCCISIMMEMGSLQFTVSYQSIDVGYDLADQQS